MAGNALTLVSAWNDKNLDYEIETVPKATVEATVASLKRQEPRLRDWNDVEVSPSRHVGFLKRQEPRLRDWNDWEVGGFIESHATWNDKNLDYEIETNTIKRTCQPAKIHLETTKNLDYEIETD